MANTGIKKYDELPARVGWKDVDAMRGFHQSYNIFKSLGETLINFANKQQRKLEEQLDEVIEKDLKVNE